MSLKNWSKTKRFLSLIFSIVMVLTIVPGPVLANELDRELEEAGDNLYRDLGVFGPYKDEDRRYYQDIEVITYEEQQEVEEEAEDDDSGFTWYNPGTWMSSLVGGITDDVQGAAQNMMVSALLMMVTFLFEFNILMTDFLLICLDVAMDGVVLNSLISVVESTIQDVSGISKSGGIISGTGVFGTLGLTFAAIAVGYMAWVFLVQRAPIQGLKSAFQPMLAVLLAILFISNFGDVLRGLNSITTEVSEGIATATQQYEEVGDFVHTVFIHRPWMYLNFDTADEEAVGKDRVETFLLNPSDSPEKREAVKAEYSEGNEMMAPGSGVKRLGYVVMFHVVNALLSAPIWILSFILFALQVYFVAIAAIAPFALIMSMLPNQGGIMIRYFKELMYPLAVKLFVSFLALIVFTIQTISFSVPTSGGFTGYWISVFVQMVIYLVLFLMRKRIISIFAAARGYLKDIAQSRKLVTDPAKQTVTGTSTVVGATVGAIAGGPQGAMAGASLGSSVGKATTGDQGAMATLGTSAKIAGLVSGGSAASSVGGAVAEGSSKVSQKNAAVAEGASKVPQATQKAEGAADKDRDQNGKGATVNGGQSSKDEGQQGSKMAAVPIPGSAGSDEKLDSHEQRLHGNENIKVSGIPVGQEINEGGSHTPAMQDIPKTQDQDVSDDDVKVNQENHAGSDADTGAKLYNLQDYQEQSNKNLETENRTQNESQQIPNPEGSSTGSMPNLVDQNNTVQQAPQKQEQSFRNENQKQNSSENERSQQRQHKRPEYRNDDSARYRDLSQYSSYSEKE